MAILITPKPLANPDIPFDRLAVSLVINPLFRPTEVTATVILAGQRYRQLADGTVEKSGEPLREVYPDVFTAAAKQAAAGDTALASALVEINAAIQKYVAARGY